MKQRICNQIPGVSHKDIEEALKDLVIKSDKSRIIEEPDVGIDDFNYEYGSSIKKGGEIKMIYMLDREEVALLVEASEISLGEQEVIPEFKKYPTYSQEECFALMNEKPLKINKIPTKKKRSRNGHE